MAHPINHGEKYTFSSPQRYLKDLKLNIQNLPPPNKESASCLHKSEKLPYETLPSKRQSYS